MARPRVLRGASMLSLLLLATTMHALYAENLADSTISSRMAQLISTGIESPKLKLNTTLPVEIQYLLSDCGLAWRDLGGTLQRLVLWDHGYVVTSSARTRELRVRCGLTMDDIVVTRDEFEELQNCPTLACTDPVALGTLLRGTVCADDQIKQLAKCAILVSSQEATAASVEVETSMIWSEEGNNTDVPQPVVYRHSLESFAVTLQPPSNSVKCPEQLALVVPCTTVESSSSSNEWCPPKKSGVVAGLLQGLVEFRQQQVTATADESPAAAGMLIAIWVIAAALTVVLCVIGVVYVRHLRQPSTNEDVMDKSPHGNDPLTPEGFFFVNTNDSKGATGSMSSEMSDFEAELEENVRRGFSSVSGPSEVDYSDALGASQVLLLFQNDPTILALRVPIIDVNGDKMVSRGQHGSPNEVLVGTLGSREVVLKRLRASKRNDTCAVERLAREIRMAATLEHPNIANIIGIAWNSFQNLMAIWEYHRSGDLRRALRSGRKAQHWTWTQQKLQIAMGILRGLSFLHTHSPPIIHGAIEPRHILLDSATGEPALCGLGHCAGRASIAPSENTSTQLGEGSIWNSPEVVKERNFSEQSDIYSFGVVLVALDTGKLLVEVSRDDLLELLTPVCPEFIREIVCRCLQSDPSARPTSRELLRHLEDISGTSSPWSSFKLPKNSKRTLPYDDEQIVRAVYCL